MKLNNYDLNKLKTFYFVYKTTSIQKAAQFLYITPAAVSMSIKGLEEELKQQLFVRSKKKLIPNKHGLKLFESVSKMFMHFEECLQSFSQMNNGEMTHIRIGAPIGWNIQSDIESIKKFISVYAKVKFTIYESGLEKVVNHLKNGQTDFAISFSDSKIKKDPTLKQQSIKSSQWALICSNQYFKKHQSLFKKNQYDQLNYCSFYSSVYDLETYLKTYIKKQSPLHYSLITDSAIGLIHAIKYSLGVVWIPLHLAQNTLDKKNYHIIQPQKAKVQEKNMLLLYLKDKQFSYIENECFNFFKQAFSQ